MEPPDNSDINHMKNEKARVLQPAPSSYKHILSAAKSEIDRIGISSAQIGEKGIKDVELFKEGSRLILCLKYGEKEFWALEANQALKRLSSIFDSASIDYFWESIKNGVNKSIIDTYMKN